MPRQRARGGQGSPRPVSARRSAARPRSLTGRAARIAVLAALVLLALTAPQAPASARFVLGVVAGALAVVLVLLFSGGTGSRGRRAATGPGRVAAPAPTAMGGAAEAETAEVNTAEVEIAEVETAEDAAADDEDDKVGAKGELVDPAVEAHAVEVARLRLFPG